MKEMRRGGVMEVHRKPVPQLSALGTVDGRHWQGLNISYLHTHYPGVNFSLTYFISYVSMPSCTAQYCCTSFVRPSVCPMPVLWLTNAPIVSLLDWQCGSGIILVFWAPVLLRGKG